MCARNDAIRKKYNEKYQILQAEHNNESDKFCDVERAKRDLQKLIDHAQGVIDQISKCNFGGDKVLSSIKTSQQGYQERMDYYNNYLEKIKEAMTKIGNEKNEAYRSMISVPRNCGVCSECNPPNVKTNY